MDWLWLGAYREIFYNNWLKAWNNLLHGDIFKYTISMVLCSFKIWSSGFLGGSGWYSNSWRSCVLDLEIFHSYQMAPSQHYVAPKEWADMPGKKQARICCFNLKMFIVDSSKKVSVFRWKQTLWLLWYSNQIISDLNGGFTGMKTIWILSIYLRKFEKWAVVTFKFFRMTWTKSHDLAQ